MRLLLVNAHGNDVTVGGAEQLVALLARELLPRGHEVSLLRAFPGAQAEALDETVLHHSDWRDNELRRVANHVNDLISRPGAPLLRALERHRPDLVHTHNLPGIGTGIWEACRRTGVPVVHTLHDYHLLCPRVTLTRRDVTPCRPSPLLCGFRRRRLGRWADAVAEVIGVSRHVLQAHEGLFDGARQHVVRNRVSAALSRPLRPPGTSLATLGYIGGLDPIKGVHVLLEAAPELARLGVELRIAGDGRLREEVVAAATLLPNVRYEGRVAGMAKEDFLEGCDLGVVPSVWAEPGGPTLTMVEWLAAGRPLLVSRRGGLGEVVDVYPGSIAIEPTLGGILGAAGALLDPARWLEAVEAVRPPAGRESVGSWVDAYEEIYRSASSRRRGASR